MNRALLLLVPVLAITSTPSPSAPQTKTTEDARALQIRADYAAWIRPYQAAPLKARFGDEPGEVKLVITAIEGDDQEPQEATPGTLRIPSGLGFSIQYGCSVSTDGRVSYFSYTARGAKGGGYPKIAEADQKSLDALIADLPADFSQLPPPGRRLVLQASSPNGVIARVYDRANAPEKVLGILRLTKSNIRSFVLTFKPKDEWKVGVHGALTATPNGSRLITSGGTGPFRFWDADSHVMLRDMPESRMPIAAGWTTSSVVVAGLKLSPDGSLLVVEGDYMIDLRDAETLKGLRHFQEWQNERQLYRLFNPQFTTDGRYLLIQSSQPALLAFDTKTLERVLSIPGLPPGASGFFPAPHTYRSVYVTPSGAIELWNPGEKRNVAQLDTDGRIVRIAYSPDESMVAAVTFHNENDPVRWGYRVRVWRLDDGSLVQELRPFEQRPNSVEGLMWSPDGSYVLAATRSASIGIWSVKTGRHRAELTGCPTNVTGIAQLSGGKLVEGCGDGVAREWQLAEVLKQVSEFEASLIAPSQGDSGPAK